MCASTPLTGQSASLFLRPFKISLTLFSYLARDVAPGNSKMTPIGMSYLQVLANENIVLNPTKLKMLTSPRLPPQLRDVQQA
jgi:hypothetical protein